MPALARILAQRYGFKCSVFFTVDPDTGFIEPGNSNIAGLEALKTADLMVVFLRFQDFPDDQMQHIADYLDRGGPVVGFRTATHAFQIKRPDAKFAKFDWQNKDDFAGGFGRQILGETWVSHYGTNHKMSSRLILEPSQAEPSRPARREGRLGAVGRLHRRSAAAEHDPGARTDPQRHDAGLAAGRRQATDAGGLGAHLHGASGKAGRVFTTTHGASEDLLNDGFRRMAVNACSGRRARERDHGRRRRQPGRAVSADDVQLRGYVKGVKPAEMAGWDTPIPPKR